MKLARRIAPVLSLVTALVLVASCTGSTAGTSTSTSTSTTGTTTQPNSSSAQPNQSSADSDSASSSSSSAGSSSSTATTPPPAPAAQVTATPAFGSTGISPVTPITIDATGGTITDLTLTNPDGKVVQGALNADATAWTLGEELGYGKTYTVAGHTTNSEGLVAPIDGSFATVDPDDTARTTVSPGDGQVVGVAAPVMVSFGVEPKDRAAVEKAVSITTDPVVEGAWAWIKHDDGRWALDYRPKDYWPENTKVHVEAKVYGIDFGNGYWGRQDVASDFSIGRNQVTIADVNSHDLIVQQDGVTVASYPASYGRGTSRDTTTRSGIHVAMEFFETKLMSNPKYGYVNLEEHWATRISDNGEFIHANPGTVGDQGNTNVSHGCVNLSTSHAKEYMQSSIYGDPVEVTGTDVELSSEDGDLYDWAIPWDKWVTMSGKNA